MRKDAIDFFIHSETQRSLVQKAAGLAERFAGRANHHDLEASFPFENFQELREEGILSLTVPKAYGGQEITLYEMLLFLERLARGDGSTTLGLGWHLGIIMKLRDSGAWEERHFRKICEDAVRDGALINSLATEPETGSPSRGAKPLSTAVRTKKGWVLNGRKTWSTLSPGLGNFLVTATIEDSGDNGEFLIPRGTPGLTVKETWNSLGMRATGSHDLILDHVELPEDALTQNKEAGKSQDGGGWLLHIPACYLGIAAAARDFAVSFAATYQPKSADHPISGFPGVRDRIGKIELALFNARAMLYQVADYWDRYPGERLTLRPELAAVKYTATNAAIEIVDSAMRIVGGRSILKEYPLERYYRDVRAGLHNPPMDDITIMMLAKQALARFEN